VTDEGKLEVHLLVRISDRHRLAIGKSIGMDRLATQDECLEFIKKTVVGRLLELTK